MIVHDPDELGHQLPPVAEEQPLDRDSRRRGSPVPYRRRRVRRRDTPKAPQTPWTAIAPTGSSTFRVLSIEDHRHTDEDAGDAADDHGEIGLT